MNFSRTLKAGICLSPFFVFLTLFYPQLGLSFRNCHELFLQLFVVFSIAILIKNIWIKGFILLSILGLFRFGFNPIYAYYFSNIVWGSALYLLVSRFIKAKEIEGVLKAVTIISLMMVGFIVLQMVGFIPLKIGGITLFSALDVTGKIIEPNWWKYGFTGIIAQPNAQGAYLAITAPLFMVYGKIKKFPIGLLLVLTAICFTHSVMAGISAGVGIFTYQFLRGGVSRKSLLITGGVIIASLLAFVKFIHYPDIASRWEAIKFAFTNNTWLGYGLGAWSLQKISVLGRGIMRQAHCEPAQVLFEMGRIGFAVIAGYILTTLYQVLKVEKKPHMVALGACLVAFFVNSVGNFSLHHALLGLLGMILMGLWQVNRTKGGVR